MTLPGVFANRLLMPDLKAFQDAHPRVELEVAISDEGRIPGLMDRIGIDG